MILRTLSLEGWWRFRPRPGAPPVPIWVPGLWEAQGFVELDGTAWYERDLDLPVPAPFATLEFDAVADHCEVWVNGEAVGGHEVGFTPFTVDVSGLLAPGRNLLGVSVTDPEAGSPLHLQGVHGKQGWGQGAFPSPPSLYLTYGGIWQPCRLVLHGPAYLGDLWCDLDPAEPQVGVAVRLAGGAEAEVEVELEAFGQRRRLGPLGPGEAVVTFDGRRAEPWTPEAPVLHTVRAVARVGGSVSHVRELRTGLRALAWTEDGVVVAGRPYRMRAVLHQGFWPRGLYAADPELVRADVAALLQAGFNTARTHLKAFEPAWLDEADRAGLLLYCDLPLGEPVDPHAFRPATDLARRFRVAVEEQVRRDRSRPSVVAWSLLNEVGLQEPGLLREAGYRELVAELVAAVRALDPRRPVVENDWLASPADLVCSPVRTLHLYGRASREGVGRMEQAASGAGGAGPLYVTELGEWGLPGPRGGAGGQGAGLAGPGGPQEELAQLVAEAGWRGSLEAWVEQTQCYQGWADRLQAERVRACPGVQGFCVTQWTDVPCEWNGLLSLDRRPKGPALEALRPALAEVAPIAILDRFAYLRGEPVGVRVVVSNWSAATVQGPARVRLAEDVATLPFDPVPAGATVEVGSCTLRAGEGCLEVRVEEWEASYPLWVVEAPRRPPRAAIVPPQALDAAEALRWERRAARGEPVVVLAQREALPVFGPLAPVPQGWGPTPYVFHEGAVRCLPAGRVLAWEVFHCYPRRYLPEVRGHVGLVVPPPGGAWGAVVAQQGSLVACQLPVDADDPFGQALVAELARLAEEGR